MLSRASRTMRFVSGPAVRTKEDVEAMLSGASDFGQSTSQSSSDVRSSLEVEALLSGTAEFPASRKTVQKRPKKQAQTPLPFNWVQVSKQGRRGTFAADVGLVAARPEAATQGGFQFDMDDEPVESDDNQQQVGSREGIVRFGAEDEPQRLSHGKLDNESQLDQQVEAEDGSKPVAPRHKKSPAKAKASPVSRPDIEQPDYGLDEQDESEPQQYLPPLPRTPKRRSTQFTHASLGFVSLGKPAAALITTDINVSRRRKAKERKLSFIDEANSTGSIPLSCEDVLVDPTANESSADAMQRLSRNLDELRPKDKTSLTEHEVKRLAKKLMDGFTMQQLVDYYRQDTAYGLQTYDAPPYPWIVEHQPWQALHSISLHRLKPKRRQAILVVTQKWKLDITEQIEGQGSMTIKLKPDIYKLIARAFTSFPP
ncbi:hypothetical protein CDD80_7610 [Ophiocordyceps camponoti-rufipedis]|uniref:SLS1 N-terminal domain-containing protein n=1 Tax=Ophiocordyceps camponoti-rufipedis TaxID=2004952 RepID=A0A2C5XDE0_9HYPO|nr:hypothetical protein CDD80_7610 [Ophiocordyceps camponoti-rufipedis]